MPRYLSAMATHSMCQPGRPWPSSVSQAGSPGRAESQSRASSGFFLPGRSGSPPRSAKTGSICSRVRPETSPKCGSDSTEK